MIAESSEYHDTLSELLAARAAVESAISELIEPQARTSAISANTHIERAREFLSSAAGRLGGSSQMDLYRRVDALETYVAMCAAELKTPLSEVAERNITKLEDRKFRDVLHGSGDTR